MATATLDLDLEPGVAASVAISTFVDTEPDARVVSEPMKVPGRLDHEGRGIKAGINMVKRLPIVLTTGVAIVVALLYGSPMMAQPAESSALRFEALSIRPCQDPRREQRAGEMYPARGSSSPGRLRTGCYPLLDDRGMGLIRSAFADTFTPINGGPSWIHSAFYDVNAIAEGDPGVKIMMGPMMQTLLEEHFKLKIHRQISEGRVYSLSVTPAGPRLHVFREGGCIPYSGSSPAALQPGERYCVSMISARSPAVLEDEGVTLDDLCRQLLGVLDRPVVNNTGITGRFDIHIEFSREGTKLGDLPLLPPASGRSPASDLAGQSSIFTAVREQLGLRLESGKGPTEVLVIDHIERPSPELSNLLGRDH